MPVAGLEITGKEAVMVKSLHCNPVRWTLAATLALSSRVWAENPPADGRELFLREWVPGDSRAGGGDGLGPVFNDSSCAACHNQGGVGGAGPAEKNVDIITVSGPLHPPRMDRASVPEQIRRALLKLNEGSVQKDEDLGLKRRESEEERERLGRIHPGFLTQRSVVLHHFSVDPGYPEWRARFARGPVVTAVGAVRSRRSQIDGFDFQRSQRNPTPLFGAGLLDSIPESALLEAAARKRDGFPEVHGRVARLEGGKVGRFGWKAQESTLDGFVRTACAVELGLQVPRRPQSGLPSQPERRAPGYDLREEEVGALVSYLASLPRPVERRSSGGAEVAYFARGESKFQEIGCAACHSPSLGEVKGLYSDLLLHDMGRRLGDQGSYGSFTAEVAGAAKADGPQASGAVPSEATDGDEIAPSIGAGPTEWRTSPLWGLRDSAPYLHDGRARTIEDAIAFHGGEGQASARRYSKLPHEDRLAIQSFLKSLTAP